MNTFRDSEAELARDDIAEIERRLGHEFPDAFTRHYLQYNGGRPKKSWFICDGGFYPVEIVYFKPMKYKTDDINLLEELYFLMRKRNAIPEDLLPFGNDRGGNFFCLDMRDGKVYFYTTDSFDPDLSLEENHVQLKRFLCDSFETFLGALVSRRKASQAERELWQSA